MKHVLFAASMAASVAFLSCSTDDEQISPKCKQSASVSYDELELDPICRSEQRKMVSVFDLQLTEVDWDYVYSHLPGYVPGSGMVPEYGSGSAYNVNGVDMTQEEYDAYKEEYRRKYGEELVNKKRELPIPCAIGNGVALLTDEEIAGLLETYDNLAIEDYREGASGGGDISAEKDEPSKGCR